MTVTVSTARNLAKRHHLERCVVLFVKDGKKQATAATGRRADDTRKLAETVYERAVDSYGELWGP